MEQGLLHTFKKSYFLKMSPNKHFLAQVNATQVNVFKYDTLQQVAQIKANNAEPFFSNDSSLLLIKESYKKLYVYNTETMTSSSPSLVLFLVITVSSTGSISLLIYEFGRRRPGL